MSARRGDVALSRAVPAWVWVLGAAALLALPTLGVAPLFDVDEGAFSEATREMLASGDFGSTTLNGAPRFDKPILIYWLQAASVALFGLHEFALRLPSALATLVWIAAVTRFTAARTDVAAGVLAGWITATAAGVLVIGRAATADALLNAVLVLALFDLWRYLESALMKTSRERTGAVVALDRVALRRAYGWIALGVLTKGPIAILIPVVVGGLCWLSLRQRAPRIGRAALRAAVDPVGWLIFIVVAVPWYVYALHVHGQAFIDGFILKHNVERFSGTLEGHGGSAFYYLVAAPLLLLPWTGLLVPAVRGVRTRLGIGAPVAAFDSQTALARFLWLWAAFVIVFFSASGTKLPHYALYGVTPLIILLAQRRTQTGSAWFALAIPTALLVVIPCLPWIAQRYADDLSDPRAQYYAAMGARSLAAAGASFYWVTLGALAASLVTAAVMARRRMPVWQRLMVAATACAIALGDGVAPWLGEVLNGPVKRAGEFARRFDEPIVAWELRAPSFSVYARRIVPPGAPEPGALAVTRIDNPALDAGADVLFREGGVAVVRRKRE